MKRGTISDMIRDFAKSTLEKWPSVYLALLRLKRRGHWSQGWIVNRETHVCIEGFPRSANSFAHAAFKSSQPDPEKLSTATHTHSPAQVVQAAIWNIPTMVCIRKPTDAIAALLAFERELLLKANKPYLPATKSEINATIRRWHHFHTRILPYKKQIYFAEFSRITGDYSSVSSDFIQRFKLDYQCYDPAKLTQDELFGRSFHVGPNPERTRIKNDIKAFITNGEFDSSIEACDQLFCELTN